MTAQIRIATASKDLFDSLRLGLARAGIGIEISAERLPNAQAALEWLEDGMQSLLVLDSWLPAANGGDEDRSSAMHATRLLHELRRRGVKTPILVIMQSFDEDLERECNPDNRAIALPLDKLQTYQAKVLKPFMAMLMGRQDNGAEGSSAISGTFRVIEVDFRQDRSVCSLGFDDKPDDLIEWKHTRSLHEIKMAANIFSPPNAYDERGWIGKVRLGGEAVFGRHVIRAIGTGLFQHIEQAGGLSQLSFRYVITDPTLYPAPFEGSVRGRDDGQDGLFVLLNAPLVRRLPRPQVIRVSRHRTAQLPPKVRVLFIRSQMSEHPDGSTVSDELVVQDGTQTNGLAFSRLDSIDHELKDMETLAAEVGPERMVLEPLNLSDFQTEDGGVRACLRSKLTSEKYDLVHYAGHAWSSGFGGREANLLVLPGATLGKAVGFPIDELAELAAEAEARFVYLSACRGTTTRSMQSFVAQGIPHALGFRCNVEDVRAAAFAKAFYRSLFKTKSLCQSFREACASARRELETEEDSPIWVTPIMLAQSSDWAMRH
ncbi:CHAT domain-containing protein [Reyranella sp.]|uniref:CHAT domain-containing protein n=1 Tax=Reyranella sp. TaxID=1929291 RepID=UPI003D10283A